MRALYKSNELLPHDEQAMRAARRWASSPHAADWGKAAYLRMDDSGRFVWPQASDGELFHILAMLDGRIVTEEELDSETAGTMISRVYAWPTVVDQPLAR